MPAFTCRGCGGDFYTKRSRKQTCDECQKDRKLYVRLQRYQVSGLEIKALFEERNGLCVLCDREATDVDHDHDTKKVRGALCHGCNLAVSRVETEGWLDKVLEYLKRGKSDTGVSKEL